MAERPDPLPRGVAPRLLSRAAAAAYCGVSPGLFDQTIARDVQAIEIRRRRLWDIKALDRWIDRRSQDAKDGDPRSIAERLNGVQGARDQDLPEPR
jgi:hypothetical protein